MRVPVKEDGTPDEKEQERLAAIYRDIAIQKEKLLEKVVEIRDINVIFPQGSNCKWKELKVIDLFEPKGGNMTYSKTWAKNNPGKM